MTGKVGEFCYRKPVGTLGRLRSPVLAGRGQVGLTVRDPMRQVMLYSSEMGFL